MALANEESMLLDRYQSKFSVSASESAASVFFSTVHRFIADVKSGKTATSCSFGPVRSVPASNAARPKEMKEKQQIKTTTIQIFEMMPLDSNVTGPLVSCGC